MTALMTSSTEKTGKIERKKATGTPKEEEDQVLESDLTQRILLSNMRHELRTPLIGIIGYSEMLIEDAEDLKQEDFIPDLQKIHSAGQEMLELVNEKLAELKEKEINYPDLIKIDELEEIKEKLENEL